MTRATSKQVGDRLREVMTWAIGEARDFTKADMEQALGLSKSQSRDAIEELVKRGNLLKSTQDGACLYRVGLSVLIPVLKEEKPRVVNEWQRVVRREPARNVGAVRDSLVAALFGDGPARVVA